MTAVPQALIRAHEAAPHWAIALTSRIASERNLPRAVVEKVVREELASFEHSPVSDFVPVLVERRVRRRLAHFAQV